jgi:hypothetical protein
VSVVFEEIVSELRSLVREALRKKEAEREIGEALFEDVEMRTEEEWREYFHTEIPAVLRKILRSAGLSCRLYHKKDDVPGPEYVANCVTRDGRKVALGLDVDYDDVAGEIVLMYAQAWGDDEWTHHS